MRDKDEVLLDIIHVLDSLKQDHPMTKETTEDQREILQVHINEYKQIIKNNKKKKQ